MKKFICVIMAVFAYILSVFSPVVGVNADNFIISVVPSVQYTSVTDDLSKAENFDASKYPAVPGDYSLQIIQVAESVNGELFVYVYQPSAAEKKLTATSINISTDIGKNLSFKNYKMRLLSRNGVLQKYIVEDLTVSNEAVRHYEITGIYRAFDDTIDESLGDDNDNTINEVVYKVGKRYCFSEENGELVQTVFDTDVIEITDKYVGFMRYPDYGLLDFDGVDVHFVAFSTDLPIDKLLEADIYFTSQSCSKRISTTYGEEIDEYAYLEFGDKLEYDSGKWFGAEYEWNAIETAQGFIASEHATYSYNMGVFNTNVQTKMTDEALQNIAGMDWVLRFAYTEYSYSVGTGILAVDNEDFTIIGNVSILRLACESEGVFYNLGVVDNKQSGDLKPDNVTTITRGLNWWLIIGIAVAVVLVIVVIVVIKRKNDEGAKYKRGYKNYRKRRYKK